MDQPRHPASQQTRLGFAAKTTLPCALSLSWIPADFRLRVVELGPRSHPHSEEWMCFFGPDASFRDLQRPTASHGHVPACPILARCEGVASRINVWVVWLLFRASGRTSLATVSCGPIWTTTARRAVILPDDQARDPVPFDPRIEARHRFHTMATWQLRVPVNREKRQRGCTPRLRLCVTGVKHPKVSRRLIPRLRWLTPCSPFSTRCRTPRVAHEDGRPGWCPSVRTSCAEAHSLVQPREGMHFPLDRGAFHRWNPTTEGIAPWIVGQALFATRPPWGFAEQKVTAPFVSLALARS